MRYRCRRSRRLPRRRAGAPGRATPCCLRAMAAVPRPAGSMAQRRSGSDRFSVRRKSGHRGGTADLVTRGSALCAGDAGAGALLFTRWRGGGAPCGRRRCPGKQGRPVDIRACRWRGIQGVGAAMGRGIRPDRLRADRHRRRLQGAPDLPAVRTRLAYGGPAAGRRPRLFRGRRAGSAQCLGAGSGKSPQPSCRVCAG